MAVFRIEKTRDYTFMSNYHLRDMSLSLKAKGLLSLMLSLPENWDYTMKGLARICKDGIDSISGGIRELETHGYLIRARVRGANGQLGSIEYTILEQPEAPSPTREKPIRENPIQANPMLDAPIQENPAQLNKEESSNYPSRTDLSITQESSPILSSPPDPRERTGQDGMRKRESYRALILENIEYDVLSQNVQLDKDRLDELVELMQNSKEVLQCYHVTGAYTFLIKVSCGSMPQLEHLILQFQKLGTTSTQIILSTPVNHGDLEALQL